MQPVSYPDSKYPIRGDFAEAHTGFWQRLQAPGTSFTSAQRIGIANEVRAVKSCGLCQQRKAALSPAHVKGGHDSVTELGATIVEAVHAITSDPSRITGTWYQSLQDQGLTDSEYIEIVSTVVATVSIDSFSSSLGLPLRALPQPVNGEPNGYRPALAQITDESWVPMLPPENADTAEADLWPSGKKSNVLRAMSLVPDEVRTLKELSSAHYLPMALVGQAGVNGGRAISRSQMELVAGRVSALNKCFY